MTHPRRSRPPRASSILAVLAFAASVLAVAPAHDVAAAPTTYTVTDLGLPQGTSPRIADINDAGEIVGTYHDPSVPHDVGFLWSPTDGLVEIGVAYEPSDISESGQVTGTRSVAVNSPRAFVWSQAGGLTTLDTLGGCCSHGVAINADGAVAGHSNTATPHTHAFVWDQTNGMTDLGTFGAGTLTTAEDMNDAGQVVGRMHDGTFVHAYVWERSTGKIPLAPELGVASIALDVNEAGGVAGHWFESGDGDHSGAFYWTPVAGMVDIRPESGRTLVFDLNEEGQVVGTSCSPSLTASECSTLDDPDISAFVWSPTDGFVDLGAGGFRSGAMAINDVGLTVGWSRDEAGALSGFVWDASEGTLPLPALEPGGQSIAQEVNGSGVIAGTAMQDGAWRAVVWTPDGTGGDGFVTTSGNDLMLAGEPWIMHGASTYGTSNPGGQGTIPRLIELATDARLNTLRIVNMFDEGGRDPTAPYAEADWERVDRILAAMEDAGLHAILDLSAFRNHLHNRELLIRGEAAIQRGDPVPSGCAGRSGDDLARCIGAEECRAASACTDPYSDARLPEWDDFLAFVTDRTNTVTGVRYEDDPTIALVAIAGEPAPPNSEEPLRPERQELTDFYASVFDIFKTYDANHLVTSGGLLHIDWEELFGNPSGSGIDHEAIFALPNQDVLSIHDYFGAFPPTEAADHKIPKVAAAAEVVGKPWITEEFGFLQEPVDRSVDPARTFSEADRADWFQLVYDMQRDPSAGVPSAGAAFWNLGDEVHPESHDVNPDTPATWSVVRGDLGDAAAPTIQLSTPEAGAAFVVGEPVEAGYSCSDEPGGSGLDTCEGDVAAGADIDTSEPGAHTFTVSAADRAGNLAEVTHDYFVVDTSGSDDDLDGLPNAWETTGIDADGDGVIDLDLSQPPFDADAQHADVFVEIDSMDCSEGGCRTGASSHGPAPGTLDDVVDAFASAPVTNPDGVDGVTLHAMNDSTVPESLATDFGGVIEGEPFDRSYDEIKLGDAEAPCDGAFGTAEERAAPDCAARLAARAMVFHYAVFGRQYAPWGSSGIAEIRGNDLMVTVGSWSQAQIDAAGGRRAVEAGTFMHELGHNLGLLHGGSDDTNCKPNYLSVMSYTLQFPSIDPTRPLDYSTVALPTLDEADLSEQEGIGGPPGRYAIYGDAVDAYVVPAADAIDWDLDGDASGSGIAADVTAVPGVCADDELVPLTGHDDWSNLDYDFQNEPSFLGGVHPVVDEPLSVADVVAVARSVDFDGDGVPNADDSCPADSNDLDADGLADACDPSNVARIDINPGSATNPIKLSSTGKTLVAIFSSAAFNAPVRVDRTSLRFGRTGTEVSLVGCGKPRDVDKDGRKDLLCSFRTRQAGFRLGDTVGNLSGLTISGHAFEGHDRVTVRR